MPSSTPYFFDSMPTRKAKTEVQLTRKLVIKCSDIRKLDEEACAAARRQAARRRPGRGGKVGATVDPYQAYYYGRYNQSNGLVRFILDDYDKLEEEAYGKAIADAEARAQRLAEVEPRQAGVGGRGSHHHLTGR